MSLPMSWIKGLGVNINTVNVEMQSDNSLRIAPVPNANPEPAQTDSPAKECVST